MTDQPDDASSVPRRANVVLRLLSLAGPEVPPDVAAKQSRPISGPPAGARPVSGPPGAWPPIPHFANEPTAKLPIIAPRTPSDEAPGELGRRPPPQRSAGRAVLVYEPADRQPWRLWVFTAVLVSLTVGVVLGQAEAYQPASSRSASAAQVGQPVVPQPSDVLQNPAAPPAVAAPLVTAPLGTVKDRQLEVTGSATTLRIRTAELGDVLFNISALDQSTLPRLTDTKGGSVLELAPTGAPGTAGAEVVLNAKVSWTLRLTGGVTDLDIDSRPGGLVGVELASGAARSVLQLPKPKGTVPLTVTGSVGELTVRTEAGAPVRVRLGKGAGLATINGKSQRDVKAGRTLTENGWRGAANRYDVKTTADVSTIVVDRIVTD